MKISKIEFFKEHVRHILGTTTLGSPSVFKMEGELKDDFIELFEASQALCQADGDDDRQKARLERIVKRLSDPRKV